MDPVITIKRIASLKRYLRFSEKSWKGATFQQVAFRGQGDADFQLTPKAFRPNTRLGYGARAINAPDQQILIQSRAEYEAVRAFTELADRIGLELPGNISHFRDHRHRRGAEAETFWTQSWPEPADLELIALAQHHGVPTRLLDFTFRPLFAAYFGAMDCLDRIKSGDQPKAFAVWAIDLRFFRYIRETSVQASRGSGPPERIREVIVPRHGNPFLHAQAGFFLVDERANPNWDSGRHTSLDGALQERTEYRSQQRGVWEAEGFDPDSRYFLPYRKIEIPANFAEATVKFLHEEGINEASVYPSYDHVHAALQFMDDKDYHLE